MAAQAKAHTYSVEMTCEGCSNALNKVLEKHKVQGIQDFKIDLPNKQVTVYSDLEPPQILEIIQKTGKTTTYISSE